MRFLGRILLLTTVAVGTVLAFLAPPAKAFQQPDLARIVFFHLPCAIAGAVFMTLGPAFAVAYLRTRKPIWDARAAAAQEVALLLAALTLTTGMLFARVQWGAWWNWDPRQTSYLLVSLMVVAYFAVRGAFPDAERRAANSGAYAVATVLPILFLIFVFPRLPQTMTLHPNVIQDGSLDGTYRGVYLLMLGNVLALAAWAYRLRVRAAELEALALEVSDGELADRDRSAATGVVRPVSVPVAGGPEGT